MLGCEIAHFMYEGFYYENKELFEEVLALSDDYKKYIVGSIPLSFANELHLNTESTVNKLWSVQACTSVTKNISLVKIKKPGTKIAAMHQRSFELSGKYYFVFLTTSNRY